LAAGSGATEGIGTVSPADATLDESTPSTPGFAPGGGICGVSLLTVLTVVMPAKGAAAGINLRLSGGIGESEAVCICRDVR